MSFLQPDPVILFFLGYKQVAFLPVVAVLALVRIAIARGPAQRWAGLALALAVLGLTSQFLPAILGVYEGLLVRMAGLWRNLWGGMGAALAASIPMVISAFARGRRWWLLDLVHLPAMAALLGLWAYSVLG